jgi:hypothetical protein
VPPSALIEKYMPRFDVRERHEAVVEAEPSRTYAELRALDVNRSLLVRIIFAIRTLPARLSSAPPPPKGQSLLEASLAAGFVLLEETPGEELVAGAVTRPWEPVVNFRTLPGPEFLAFAEPGFTKIAWSIAVAAEGPGRSRAITETRVHATDPVSRRRFRRYWILFGVGIKLIRVLALRLLRKDLRAGREV